MLQNTDSSSLKKKKSNIYTHCNNKLRTYCLIKSEYRMEAYLASYHTNRKMLAKLRFLHLFIYLFTFFIYFYLFIYLIIYLFIYLLLTGEEQRNISFPSICNVMTYV